MRWFRLYTEMLDDEKVQMLTPELFRTWVNLLCVAAKNDGKLPPVDTLSFKLRVSKHDMQSRLEDLVLAGLIDIREDKTFEPHNWQQRQWKSDDSAERVRKHREEKRKCNGYTPVTETPSESSDTDTDNTLVPSSFGMPRAKEQSFNLDSGRTKGKAKKGSVGQVVKRAEGFGLDVERLMGIMNGQPKVESPPAYFTTLCLNEIKRKLPGINEDLVRDALWGKGNAAGILYEALMKAEAA